MKEKSETIQLKSSPDTITLTFSDLDQDRRDEMEKELIKLVEKYSAENEEKRKICKDITDFIKTLMESNNLINATFEHDIDYRYEEKYPVKADEKVKSRLIIEYWSSSHATS